jgi:hypothetical protein
VTAVRTLAPFVALTLVACVDPLKDYNDYLARTADADTTIPTDDAAAYDAPSADGGFQNQMYVMACVSQATQDNATDAVYFVGTGTFIETDSMGDGTFNWVDTALPYTNNGTTPPSTTMPTVGETVPVNGSVVTGGKVDVAYGATTTPAAADPIGGDIVFVNSTLHFLIGPGTNLCATLSGDLMDPLQIPMLDPKQNICIFTAFTGSSTTFAPFTQDQFHCP